MPLRTADFESAMYTSFITPARSRILLNITSYGQLEARKYSQEEFAEAWLSSSSIAQVAKKLGCNMTGGGYIALKMAARELGLDNSHMTGQGWNIGWQSNPSRERVIALSDILVKNSTYTTIWRLKRRLLREGILEYKCYLCGLTEWNGKPITLQLDHINGVHSDHRIENLRFLCPNCHSQTETFAGRNKG